MARKSNITKVIEERKAELQKQIEDINFRIDGLCQQRNGLEYAIEECNGFLGTAKKPVKAAD